MIEMPKLKRLDIVRLTVGNKHFDLEAYELPASLSIHRKGEQIYPEQLPVKVVVANMLENCRAFNYTPERTTERLLESLTITRKGGLT